MAVACPFASKQPHDPRALQGLRVLSMACNRLTGGIPDSVTQLCLLESLWLQGNKLCGGLPRGIARIKSLKV